MTRVWKDRAGPWGEAQRILHIEASAVLELLKREVDSTAANQRVIECRKIALSHASESMGYLLIGDVPMAANHILAADAWRALSMMTDDVHDATTAAAAQGICAGPLAAELRKSANLVLGEACDARACRAEGHELEPADDESLAKQAEAARQIGVRWEPPPRRCLGPRNGLHKILALVPRPAAARGRGPTKAGPAFSWTPS